MVQLTDLSNELLSQILQYLENVRPSTLYNLLFTCKTLHLVSKDIICRHVLLSSLSRPDSALLSFLRQDYADKRILSLRLRFERDHLYSLRYCSVTAFNCLEPFYARLGNFDRLTTFSLNQEGQTGYDAVLPSSMVFRLLENLPKSVINLELDTAGVKDVPELSPSTTKHFTNPQMLQYRHVCQQISRLIPQLKCLRLRVPYLCSGITHFQRAQLSQPDLAQMSNSQTRLVSPLQVIMIRLDVGMGSDTSRRGTRDCCRAIDPRSRSEKLLNENEFCNGLTELVQQGYFPHIKVFRVMFWPGDGTGVIRDLVDGDLIAPSEHRFGGLKRYDFVPAAEQGIEWTESANGARRPDFMGRAGNFNIVTSDLEV